MPWSYNPALATDKDRVRFLIGDVDTANQLAQNEEIEWVVKTEANVYMAASVVAKSLARKLRNAGLEELKAGETKIRFQRAADLLALANDLALRGSNHQVPSAGGVFQADTDTLNEDTTLRDNAPAFTRELHDHNS